MKCIKYLLNNWMMLSGVFSLSNHCKFNLHVVYHVMDHKFLITGNIRLEYCRVFYHKTLHWFYFVWALYSTTLCSFYKTSISHINIDDINTICVALNFMSVNSSNFLSPQQEFPQGGRCCLSVFYGCPRGPNWLQPDCFQFCLWWLHPNSVWNENAGKSGLVLVFSSDKTINSCKFILFQC